MPRAGPGGVAADETTEEDDVMHEGRTRRGVGRAAVLGAALVTMGGAGCGGRDDDLRGAQPARSGASGGEVLVPGATATRPDTVPPAGPAVSGSAAVRELLAAIDAAETEMSQLALQKARGAEVRRYAQAMIAAHRQAPLDRPVETADSTGANDLLAPLVDAHRKAMTQLRELEVGPAFDRAYITAQVQGHEGALQALERGETEAGDATLIDRVRRMQGDVERHLAEARRVRAQLPTRRGGTR